MADIDVVPKGRTTTWLWLLVTLDPCCAVDGGVRRPRRHVHHARAVRPAEPRTGNRCGARLSEPNEAASDDG